MTQIPEFEKELKQIAEEGDEARLTAFGESITQLESADRHHMAFLFIKQGEELLRKQDKKALSCFVLAQKLAPNNAEALTQLAEAYSTQSNNMKCLQLAYEAAKDATTVLPSHLEAWLACAKILVKMAILEGDIALIKMTEEKLSQAEKIAGERVQEVYWLWGKTYFIQGKISGEANDYHMALNYYHRASSQGSTDPVFWINYGQAMSELALLLNRPEQLCQAVDLYRNALKIDPNQFQAWYHLGLCCKCLFESQRSESYFNFAQECFSRAVDLNAEDATVWFNWAYLLLEFGKQEENLEHLRASCQKFAKAHDLDSENPVTLYRWADAQMTLGSQLEELEFLKQAEEKIIRSLEIHSDDSLAWGIYGTCLTELGRYFDDETLYEQAIEKFNYGLSLQSNSFVLWHGLALAYFSLGNILYEPAYIESACNAFAKAMAWGGNISQFWNDWGVALMTLGEMREDKHAIESAIEKFERCLGTDWERNPDVDIQCLYNYGCALDFLGEIVEEESYHEKSIQVLTLLINKEPEYLNAKYCLAVAYSHLAQLTDDIELFHKALDLYQHLAEAEPEDGPLWNDWGMTLLHLADIVEDQVFTENKERIYQAAEEKFMRSSALGCTQSYYSFACLYAILGDFSIAMHFLQRADKADSLSLDDLLHKDWFEQLRDTPDFQHFIMTLAAKYQEEK